MGGGGSCARLPRVFDFFLSDLSGESYAGQYLPNIAYFITEQMPSQFTNLKGILVGNGCWGGTATETQCNGPNSEQNDLDMYFGKGLVSKRTYNLAYSSCKFPKTNGLACQAVLADAFNEVGPHNVYDIYDNCPQTAEWLKRTGKSMRWLINNLRSKMYGGTTATSTSISTVRLVPTSFPVNQCLQPPMLCPDSPARNNVFTY